MTTALRSSRDFDVTLGEPMRARYLDALAPSRRADVELQLSRAQAAIRPEEVIATVAPTLAERIPARVSSLAELQALAPGFPFGRVMSARIEARALRRRIESRARSGYNPFSESELVAERTQARIEAGNELRAFTAGKPIRYGKPAGYSREELLLLLPELPDLDGGLLIRSWADAEAILTPEQLGAWTRRLRTHRQFAGVDAKLKAGEGDYRQNEILQALGALASIAADPLDKQQQQRAEQRAKELAAPRSLADANLIAASEALTPAALPVELQLDDGATVRPLDTMAQAFGVKVDQPEADKRAAIAVQLAQLSTAFGVYFGELATNPAQAELIARALANGVAGAAALSGSAGNFFSDFARGFKRLVRDPLGWARRVFVTEPGKAIRNIGAEILRGRRNVPFLGKFFLDPFGFTAQATFLEQLGEAMVDGSISAFDEAKFGFAVGRTFSAAGEALIAASPFLPPPFNVIAAAAGALSKAAGELLQGEIGRAKRATDARHAQERAAKAAALRAEQVKAYRPAFGKLAVEKLRAAIPSFGVPVDVRVTLQKWTKAEPELLTAWAFWRQLGEWRAFAVEGRDGIPYAAQAA